MRRQPRFYKRSILWFTVLPVLLLGLLVASVSIFFLVSPLASYLEERTDQQLRLASDLGLAVCDEKLAYLLELRMEDDPEILESIQREAVSEITGLSRKLGGINLMVVTPQADVLGSSDPFINDRCSPDVLAGGQGGAFTCQTRGVPMRMAKSYFPFWRWTIVSFIAESDYMAPSRLVSRTVYIGTFGVAVLVGLALLLVLEVRLRRPLKRLLAATEQLAGGSFPRVATERQDELGQVMQAFNSMVESLEQQQKHIRLVLDDLTESEERYRLFTENSLAVVAVVQDGRFVFANHTTLGRSGYSASELIGMPAGDLVHPEDRELLTRRGEGKEYRSGGTDHFELRYLTKEGQTRWLEVLATPIIYRGRPAVLGHGIDITVRKEAQAEQDQLRERLEHAQRMEVVGTLAGGIAHDFNNLLQVIGGYCQLLLLKKDKDDPERPSLIAMDQTARRGSDLVRQLLSFGRRVASRTKPVDLNQEVVSVAHILERTIPRMIQVQTRLAPGLPRVMADPTQLEQILMNLGGNAKDAMPEGGVLTFHTGLRGLDEQYCLGLVDVPPGEYLELKVTDTGVGMDEETQKHIFEPFFTTKLMGQGTGLGLSSVYGLVKAHRGHITCTSRPGMGTTFTVYLPLMLADEASAEDDQPPARQVAGGSETILLADDEPSILDLARESLVHYGYRVLVATSGEAALETYAADPNGIDLVVLDLGMPGMGGARCLSEIRKLDPEAAVLVASGYADEAQVEHCLAGGAMAFVAKPYRLNELLNQVRRALDRSAG